MSYEGAMLGGVLLPKDEFVDLMIQLLEQRKDVIFYALDDTLKAITNKDFKQAYQKWDQFQTEILKNPTTSLLAILNFTSTENQQWTFIDNETNAINNHGIINIQQVGEDLRRTYISSILTQHLSNLFHELNEQMDIDEIMYLYDLNRKEIYRQLNPIKYGDKVYTYKAAIYGNIYNKYYSGKVADAYVNHVGETHTTYLNNFSQGDLSGLDHLATSSVKAEEKARNQLNFVKLLIASTNRTAWYSGGDLIIVNNHGQIVANIQIKTSYGAGETIGMIRTASLAKMITNIKQLINTDNKEIAIKFYEALKTSAVVENLGTAVIEEGYKIAAQTLQLNNYKLINL